MEALSEGSRWGLAVGVIVVIGFAVAFGRYQNHGRRLGGPISRPKLLWLALASYGWFVVAPILGWDGTVDPDVRFYLQGFTALVVLRAVVELAMLYIAKRWIPALGIGLNAACAAWIGVALAILPRGPDLGTAWTWAFLLWLAATCVLETYYALAYQRVVRGRTDGEAGNWFATDGDPKFGRLNRITAAANVPVLLFLGICVAGILTA